MKLQTILRASASALAVAVLTLSACGPLHLGRHDATIIFTNDSMDQADVYATVANATAVRLGTVMSTRTETLRVPASVTGQGGATNIYARLLARNLRPSTGPIVLREGDQIRVRLTADSRSLVVTPGGQ